MIVSHFRLVWAGHSEPFQELFQLTNDKKRDVVPLLILGTDAIKHTLPRCCDFFNHIICVEHVCLLRGTFHRNVIRKPNVLEFL